MGEAGELAQPAGQDLLLRVAEAVVQDDDGAVAQPVHQQGQRRVAREALDVSRRAVDDEHVDRLQVLDLAQVVPDPRLARDRHLAQRRVPHRREVAQAVPVHVRARDLRVALLLVQRHDQARPFLL